MKRIILTVFLCMTLVVAATQAQAYNTTLTEYAFNLDGVVVDSFFDSMPLTPSFNTTSGLGTIEFSFLPGSHSVLAFFDHEINVSSSGWTPEFGNVSGTLKTGQSWQIDEPGYGNLGYFGSIYDKFSTNALNNTNMIPNGDDVSMAIGWNFTVPAAYKAKVQFILGQDAPNDSFYLMQLDDLSTTSDKIYFNSTLEMTPDNTNHVPEPSTFILFSLAIAGLALYRKR